MRKDRVKNEGLEYSYFYKRQIFMMCIIEYGAKVVPESEIPSFPNSVNTKLTDIFQLT